RLDHLAGQRVRQLEIEHLGIRRNREVLVPAVVEAVVDVLAGVVPDRRPGHHEVHVGPEVEIDEPTHVALRHGEPEQTVLTPVRIITTRVKTLVIEVDLVGPAHRRSHARTTYTNTLLERRGRAVNVWRPSAGYCVGPARPRSAHTAFARRRLSSRPGAHRSDRHRCRSAGRGPAR